MNRTPGWATLVCIASLSWIAPALAQDIQPPMLRAGMLPETLAVDGMLNEPAWNTAETTDAFTQTDPAEGAMAAARTVVRVLASPNALAIGIACDDPDPKGVVSFSVRRDAPLGNEDHVRIVLDPFLDGRSGRNLAGGDDTLGDGMERGNPDSHADLELPTRCS